MIIAELWLLWWVWIAVALVFGIAEILVPGFIFLGFALGAALVGLLVFFGLLLGLAPLLLIFAALSLIAWMALRRIFALPSGQVKRIRHDINE